ncbi:MAG: nucleotide exchange factor GrpE [Lachnospiraceae bacterium]|nr:nucleotide exchange factor GrpE [Lachnospiraceae bacterium]
MLGTENEEETAKTEAPDDEKEEDQEKGAADETREKEEAEAPDGEDGKKDAKKKGFFNKKKDPKDTQIEELIDRLKRTMAEFDNFRKRTEKEKASMYEIGARDIIEKMLPVVDNFERGLASVPEEAKGTPFADGMEKIYKRLMKTLDDLGVKPIEAVGKPFDPDFHNAVMHIEDENLGENIVAAELQKGYLYRDSVVRHSMVQVAN